MNNEYYQLDADAKELERSSEKEIDKISDKIRELKAMCNYADFETQNPLGRETAQRIFNEIKA